jgi:hypothetical protein
MTTATLTEGTRVRYDAYDGAPAEYGTVTRPSNDPSLIFVRYDAQPPAADGQATPIHRLRVLDIGDCTCLYSCGDDPAEGCSLSGREWHVHPQDRRGVTGPCPLHPDAPGDL